MYGFLTGVSGIDGSTAYNSTRSPVGLTTPIGKKLLKLIQIITRSVGFKKNPTLKKWEVSGNIEYM